jgi:hypothetical protein
MAVLLDGVVGYSCEAAEVHFPGLNRLEGFGMSGAGNGDDGDDGSKQSGTMGHQDLRVGRESPIGCE